MGKNYIDNAKAELTEAAREIKTAAIETGSHSLYHSAISAFHNKKDFVKKLLR